METIRTFHSLALGEKHKLMNIPCQDAADSFEDTERGVFIGAISDGHGGKDYFRSDIGSKLLVEISIESLKQFITTYDKSLFNVDFRQRQTRITEIKECPYAKVRAEDDALHHLFSYIIIQWNDAIKDDWFKKTPTIDEMDKLGVSQDSSQAYLQGINIEKVYGCTLISFLRTNKFWAAFQLGDGKCIAFDNDVNPWEPVLWDEQCTGNITTSICEGNAIDNFRYSYGNERFPIALFIGSDGMDGAYGDLDEFSIPLLTKLYFQIIKRFSQKGYTETITEIHDLLPRLSAHGVAHDDMSLAGWIDMEKTRKLLPFILKKEIEENIKCKTAEVNRLEILIASKHEEAVRMGKEITEQEEVWKTMKKKCQMIEDELRDLKIEHEQISNEISILAKEMEDLG